jgi:hypothetical protein
MNDDFGLKDVTPDGDSSGNFARLQQLLDQALVFGRELEADIEADDTPPAALNVALQAHALVHEVKLAMETALLAYARLN